MLADFKPPGANANPDMHANDHGAGSKESGGKDEGPKPFIRGIQVGGTGNRSEYYCSLADVRGLGMRIGSCFDRKLEGEQGDKELCSQRDY